MYQISVKSDGNWKLIFSNYYLHLIQFKKILNKNFLLLFIIFLRTCLFFIEMIQILNLRQTFCITFKYNIKKIYIFFVIFSFC